MFVSHPDTECVVRQMEHLERLGKVTAARRSAEVPKSSTDRPAGIAIIQRQVSSVVVALGQRLRGAKPVGLSSATVAGGDATS